MTKPAPYVAFPPTKFGATLITADKTEFRIWAPDAESMQLLAGNLEPIAMVADDNSIYFAVAEVGAGTKYRYRVDGNIDVPDPASRCQDGDVDDASIVIDPAYAWKHPEWRGRPWNETVIYELHVGVFGGFLGVTAQLSRLASLGITAVELMPIADFPGQRGWGYDGVLHYAPEAGYGTPQDLKILIDTAHGLGIMVFLDVVYNHFGPTGNYLNAYAKSFFRADVHTPWGNAIDFRKLQVRRFYIENALYWLEDFKFDGLRFDAVSMIKDATFLQEMAAELKNTAGAGRHIHLMLENENNEAGLLNDGSTKTKYDAQWTDDWHHAMHVLLTGETEAYYEDFLTPATQLARCLSEGFSYQGERSPHAHGKPRGVQSAYLPPSAFVIFLQNHDQIGNRALGERLQALVEPKLLRAATILLLVTPQIPLIFMGDEWAETKPFLFFTDHHEELAEIVREGRRKEFAGFAAFSNPDVRKNIPDPNAQETFLASRPTLPETPSLDQSAMLELYQRALTIRAAEIAPRIPGAVSQGASVIGERVVHAAWRFQDATVLDVIINFSNVQVLCPAIDGMMLISSEPLRDDHLPPFSCFAWLSKPG